VAADLILSIPQIGEDGIKAIQEIISDNKVRIKTFE